MTFGEMNTFTQRFNEICETQSEAVRDVRLATLMTDLEITYTIPMFNSEKFNSENIQLMQLYCTVSDARSL